MYKEDREEDIKKNSEDWLKIVPIEIYPWKLSLLK
jgi:hypothetical protein